MQTVGSKEDTMRNKGAFGGKELTFGGGASIGFEGGVFGGESSTFGDRLVKRPIGKTGGTFGVFTGSRALSFKTTKKDQQLLKDIWGL
jgi:hypothetical protein